ncbi:MAG TPA: SGNH/GDSL hydrolase family protein [bacterium]
MSGDLSKNILLSVCSLVVLLGTAEALCRLKYSPERLRDESLFEYDRDKIYRLRRGVRKYFAGIDDVTINSSGFRGPEVSQEKPAGTTRIVVLGDSVSFGHGVPDDAPYPRVLEHLLNGGGAPGKHEVLDLGVPGYSIFQEYQDFKRALAFKPDLAILQFNLNDVLEPYAYLRRFGGAGEMPTMPDVIDGPYYHYFLSGHSALYLFLRDVIASIEFLEPSGERLQREARRRETLTEENLVFRADLPEVERGWRDYLTWLEKLAALAGAQHVPLVVLASPRDFQLVYVARVDSPQEILGGFCRKHGITFVDPLPDLRSDLSKALGVAGGGSGIVEITAVMEAARERPEEVARFWGSLFLDENHPNVAGHRYLARELYPQVLRLLAP